MHRKINTKGGTKFFILDYRLSAYQEPGPELEHRSGWPRGFGLLTHNS